MAAPICKCGKSMKYLVGNSGLEAYWCDCGRAVLTDNGKVQNWFEPKEKGGPQQVFYCSGHWPDCPWGRRVEAIEKTIRQIKGETT